MLMEFFGLFLNNLRPESGAAAERRFFSSRYSRGSHELPGEFCDRLNAIAKLRQRGVRIGQSDAGFGFFIVEGAGIDEDVFL